MFLQSLRDSLRVLRVFLGDYRQVIDCIPVVGDKILKGVSVVFGDLVRGLTVRHDVLEDGYIIVRCERLLPVDYQGLQSCSYKVKQRIVINLSCPLSLKHDPEITR